MFQDKIKREKPPHHDAPVSFSPVADVLNSKRPVDPLAGNPARLSAAVEGNYIGFDRRPLFDQCLHETQRRHSLGIEVMTELRPRENAAVETDNRNPFRLPSGPAERFQCSLPSAQVLDHGSPNGPRSPRLRFCQIGPRRQRTEALAGDLKEQVAGLRRDYKEIAEVLRGV